MFRRKQPATKPEAPPTPSGLLDEVLVEFSPVDPWRVRDACEGTQIFGATGSGKTSGSGRTLAKAFLEAGFGGLILTVKPDERQMWEAYCDETKRRQDLVIFSPEQPARFNFLQYEYSRGGVGAGVTENLVTLFTNVIEAGQEIGPATGEDIFWQRALKQLLRHAINLCALAYDRVTLQDLYAIVSTAPTHPGQPQDDAWCARSACWRALDAAEGHAFDPVRAADFAHTFDYWLRKFPAIPEKTRGSILIMFLAMADGFLLGHLRELFCTDTTVTPEITLDGKLLLIDLPVKEWDDFGRYAQVLWKYIWQRAVERRHIHDDARPVFLWADEAQNFFSSYDATFQSTARSSRACTVYLTQNLANYQTILSNEAHMNSLLGNLQTKIFHANGDSITNEWASRLFGQAWTFRASASVQHDPSKFASDFVRTNMTSGTAQQSLEHEVLPARFTRLHKGGPDSGMVVEAIVFQGGRVWGQSGKSYLYVSFDQND